MTTAVTAMIPPMAREPVSPINSFAGNALNHRNPMSAPTKAHRNTTISSDPGMYITLRYSANCTCPDTYARIPSAVPIIAEFPAHIPSIPSLRFAPLLTAMITNVVTKMNNIHPHALLVFPDEIHEKALR